MPSESYRLNAESWLGRRAAVLKLAADASPQSIAIIIGILRDDPEEKVRQAAAKVLGNHPGVETTAALLEVLHDADWGVRRQAARSLAQSDDPAILQALIAVLGDEDIYGSVSDVLVERPAELVFDAAFEAYSQAVNREAEPAQDHTNQ
jgi:HEAT repeat protein